MAPESAGESRLSRCFYETTRLVAAPVFALGFSLRVCRAGRIPDSGPLLIIANHQSFLDPPIIGQSFSRPLVYLARKTLFRNPMFATLIRGLGAVPIDQDGVGKEGIKAVLEQLSLGKAVVVFPEGTRSPDGRLQPFRPGIHLLIRRTNAPILPVGVAGAFDAWPLFRKYPIPSPLFLPPTPRTLAVAIGLPLDAARFAELPRDQAMSALEHELALVQSQAERIRRK